MIMLKHKLKLGVLVKEEGDCSFCNFPNAVLFFTVCIVASRLECVCVCVCVCIPLHTLGHSLVAPPESVCIPQCAEDLHGSADELETQAMNK